MAKGNLSTQAGQYSAGQYSIGEHVGGNYHGTSNADGTLTNSIDAEMNAFIVRLHETLDLCELFDMFTEELSTRLKFDGIEYSNDLVQSFLSSGETGKQRCHYRLKYQQYDMGSIDITREQAFADHEVETVEVMLSGLTLPLRNALRYKQATDHAQRDELTGLRNVAYYHDTSELEIKRAHRYKKLFSLALFDIDNFEHINQQYGRGAGDAVLQQVASRIGQKVRTSDIVYRYGGDKFLVFLPNTESERSLTAAQRIKDFVMSDRCLHEVHRIPYTLSAGVVTVSYEDSASSLMDRANRSLLQAKILGKNRIYCESLVGALQTGGL